MQLRAQEVRESRRGRCIEWLRGWMRKGVIKDEDIQM